MKELNLEWEDVVYDRRTGTNSLKSTVRISKASKSIPCCNRVVISGDLCKSLGWVEGTRVNVRKSKDGVLLAFKSDPSGLETLKSTGSSSSLVINSVNMVTHLGLPIEIVKSNTPTDFDAWVSDGMVIFKMKSA